MNKKIISLFVAFGLILGFGLGVLVSDLNPLGQAFAQEEEEDQEQACTMTQERLEKVYNLAFHRGLDEEADFHQGKDLDQVLEDIQGSEEQNMYSALYKATKALEEAQREPGDLTKEDLEVYKDYIDQASSIVNEWAKDLPDQAAEDAVVGPDQAKEAIQNAYQNMNETAQEAAEKGLIQAEKSIGPPSELPGPTDAGKEKEQEESKNGDLSSADSCDSDSDCILVDANCCPCNMGGEQKCINEEYEDPWISELNCEEKENIACPAVYLCGQQPSGCECTAGTCSATE